MLSKIDFTLSGRSLNLVDFTKGGGPTAVDAAKFCWEKF